MKLIPYEASFDTIILGQIAEFFGFHQTLTAATSSESCLAASDDTDTSRLTLAEWQAPPNALFVIIEADIAVGFVRINYRGGNVAWIEDIFVDSAHRGKGIAPSAIAAAEDIVQNVPGYTAICMDVSPRNAHAIRLYHKLGYTDLSLVTLRKEFSESTRDRPVHLLDLDFKY